MKWLGIQILIENSFGNDKKNISKHFQSVCEKNDIIFSFKRFQTINNNFDLENESISTVCSLLSKQSYNLISSLDILTVDECLIGYKPRFETKEKYKKIFDEIPLVYIPRKPHPNGLLIYLSSTGVMVPGKKNKVPFILNLFPNLNIGFGMTPSSSVLKLLLDFPENLKKPIIVCDVAFGSINLGSKILDWGGDFHFSMSSNHEKNIWSVLSHKLLIDKSRVCKNSNNNFIFSCMMIESSEKNISFQNIMSSFFVSSENPSTEFSLIENFPIYSERELKKLKRDDLRNICKDFKIEVPKKLKKNLVSIIYKTSKDFNLKGSRKKELLFNLNENFFSENNLLHNFYRLHFNNVDLADALFYKTEDHHNYTSWRFKLIKGIMRFGIINCWVASLTQKNSRILDFREELALNLIFFQK